MQKENPGLSSLYKAPTKEESQERLPWTMGLLSAGAQMLADSGWSYNPMSTGQIIGRGLMQGIQGYQVGQGMVRQEKADAAAIAKSKRDQRLEDERFKWEKTNQEAKVKYDTEILKKTQRENQISALQMETYNNFHDHVDEAVKKKLITEQDADYIKTQDPVNGMKMLTTLAGKNRTKLTGVSAEPVIGPNGEKSNYMAFFQDKGDGTQEFIKIVENPNALKKQDIKTGADLTTLLGGGNFDPERYYMKDKDGKWSPVDPNSFKDAMALHSKAEKVLSQYGDLKRQYGAIQDNVKRDSAAGDLAIVFSFMKMLDPGSVVRESEFGQVVASSGYFDRAVQWYRKNFGTDSGERLPQDLRNDLLRVSREIKNRFQTEADGKIKMFNALKNTRQGIDFQKLVFTNPLAEIEDIPIPPNTGNTGNNNPGTGNVVPEGFLKAPDGIGADAMATQLFGRPATWKEYMEATGETDVEPDKFKNYKKVNSGSGSEIKKKWGAGGINTNTRN
mgnify:CR=1 FL=1